MYRYMLLELFFWQLNAFLMHLYSNLAGSRWRARKDILFPETWYAPGEERSLSTVWVPSLITVVNYSTRQHERCNSDTSGETSAAQVCLLLLLSFLSLFFSLFYYYFIIFTFDKNQVMLYELLVLKTKLYNKVCSF